MPDAAGARGRGAAHPHGLHAPCAGSCRPTSPGHRRGGRGAAAGEELDIGMPVCCFATFSALARSLWCVWADLSELWSHLRQALQEWSQTYNHR